MSDINRVLIGGRTTADITVDKTNSGKSVCTFSVAVAGRKKDDVDYVRVQAWDKAAENLAKYVGKGSKITVEGRLSVHNYEKDGQKRTSTLVIADNIQWDNLKAPNAQNAPAQRPAQPQPQANLDPFAPAPNQYQPRQSVPYTPYSNPNQYGNNGRQNRGPNNVQLGDGTIVDTSSLPF